MTHSPTLPNGFSTDFSEVPEKTSIVVFAHDFGLVSGLAIRDGDRLRWEWPWRSFDVLRPLCWCPIPTPGDAVLKELAEGK